MADHYWNVAVSLPPTSSMTLMPRSVWVRGWKEWGEQELRDNSWRWGDMLVATLFSAFIVVINAQVLWKESFKWGSWLFWGIKKSHLVLEGVMFPRVSRTVLSLWPVPPPAGKTSENVITITIVFSSNPFRAFRGQFQEQRTCITYQAVDSAFTAGDLLTNSNWSFP